MMFNDNVSVLISLFILVLCCVDTVANSSLNSSGAGVQGHGISGNPKGNDVADRIGRISSETPHQSMDVELAKAVQTEMDKTDRRGCVQFKVRIKYFHLLILS
jgi:hypothetical protein